MRLLSWNIRSLESEGLKSLGITAGRHRKESQVAQVVKNLPANAGDTGDEGSIPGLRRSPARANSNPFQYPCLGNPMGRGAWWGTVDGVAESQMRMSIPSVGKTLKILKSNSLEPFFLLSLQYLGGQFGLWYEWVLAEQDGLGGRG